MATIKDFDKNDWDHMHDCMFSISGKKPSQDEMLTTFNTMPGELQLEAAEFGMNDTVWRDQFITWYVKHIADTSHMAKNVESLTSEINKKIVHDIFKQKP